MSRARTIVKIIVVSSLTLLFGSFIVRRVLRVPAYPQARMIGPKTIAYPKLGSKPAYRIPNLNDLYRHHGKRTLDVIFSSILLVLLLPALVMIALVVRFKLGSPVLFQQQRPGLHGKPFMMVKFRSMTDARDADGNLLPDEQRLTPFGKFLRSTSLDELPELYNVLRGDMSLVGPRPLLMRYLDRYSAEQFRRHDVRPGITGWTQINGRNALSWNDKFKLDVWYVDRVSIGLDLKIMLATFNKVIERDGVSREGYATTPEFMGHEAAGD